jgi:hypothetical protein
VSDYVSRIFYNAPSFVEITVNELGTIASDKDSYDSSIAVICKEDEAQELFKLFSNYDIEGYSFDFGHLDFDPDNYDKEYAILIYEDGLLCIEKVYDDYGEIKIYTDDVVYIHESCNSKVKLYEEIYNTNVMSFGIGLYE